jgi:phospholipid/cholesterol/gamma-HCH transport system substrate-binding protein
MSNTSTNPNQASTSTKFKVGLFVVFGLFFIGLLTVYINNRPFWWRSCEPVQITVEDATGLKAKSPVKSLGLEIGYIADIGLVSTGVKVKVCITAPVEVQPDTKAYVRGEGFLGDRFLELKPVKYTGKKQMEESTFSPSPTIQQSPAEKTSARVKTLNWIVNSVLGVNQARADDEVAEKTVPAAAPVAEPVQQQQQQKPSKNGKEIPVAAGTADMQQVMTEVNGLMKEVKDMTTNLNSAINPDEIRGTIKQLNKTLEDASKAFSPQGGLTATAQRSLIKLEDAIEQLRDQMTRINQGQGSIGMMLNDPVYAEELKKALANMNHLLNRASDMRLNVSLGLFQLSAYQATRASFEVKIWPRPDRFYRIGLGSDPRGKISQTTTTTEANGTTNTVRNTQVDQGGYVFTAMIGKRLHPRVDLSVGILNGDGAAALGINLGWGEDLEMLQAVGELYFRSETVAGAWTARPDGRIYMILQPISILYVQGGVEGLRKINGNISAFYGAGIRFDDEDIRLLFSFL